jgi:Fe2+ transport system protein B
MSNRLLKPQGLPGRKLVPMIVGASKAIIVFDIIQ